MKTAVAFAAGRGHASDEEPVAILTSSLTSSSLPGCIIPLFLKPTFFGPTGLGHGASRLAASITVGGGRVGWSTGWSKGPGKNYDPGVTAVAEQRASYRDGTEPPWSFPGSPPCPAPPLCPPSFGSLTSLARNLGAPGLQVHPQANHS